MSLTKKSDKMPTYIYVHPETKKEIEIFHPMSEIKNPSKELLEKITLPDGRIMQRKIVAPALLGFDNLGRSIWNGKSESKGSTSSDSKAASTETAAK